MEIENCGSRAVISQNAPILEEVKNLPKVEDAKNNVIYRDINNNLWVITEDGWQQINKDEKQHVPAKITGKNMIDVTSSGVDNQTFVVDGKNLGLGINDLTERMLIAETKLGYIYDALNNEKGGIAVPKTVYESKGEAKESYDVGNYNDYDYCEIYLHMGSTRSVFKYSIKDLKGNGAHPSIFNFNDTSHQGNFSEVHTKLENDNQLTIKTVHSYSVYEDASKSKWEFDVNKIIFVDKIVMYKYIVIPETASYKTKK